LAVVSDESQLLPMCEELIALHPKEAEAVRSGKQGVIGFFVGQVMKRTNKQANPAVVSKLFAKLLAPDA
jgi:aspartyl-tRNA(Asn)/glutamyl-tRNA(Gln) amidotransferase subunit B